MRTHGTLIKWNDDRGFGFISAAQGNNEVFVHISAFPRDGVRPRINELVSYEAETTPDGKQRAVRIMRPGGQRPPHLRRRHEPGGRSSNAMEMVFSVVAVVAIGAYVYSRIFFNSGIDEPDKILQSTPSIFTTAMPDSSFECDGRVRCSEMTSCAEARYFVQHCPNTMMDGDHDGEPCEQQWCN